MVSLCRVQEASMLKDSVEAVPVGVVSSGQNHCRISLSTHLVALRKLEQAR